MCLVDGGGRLVEEKFVNAGTRLGKGAFVLKGRRGLTSFGLRGKGASSEVEVNWTQCVIDALLWRELP